MSSVCKCSVTSHKNFKGRSERDLRVGETDISQSEASIERADQSEASRHHSPLQCLLAVWIRELKFHTPGQERGERGFYFSHYVKCCVANFCPSEIF